MVKASSVLVALLYASLTVLASPLRYSAAEVERMRAEGRSEHEILTAFAIAHPSPAFIEAPARHAHSSRHSRLPRDTSGDVVPSPRLFAADTVKREQQTTTEMIASFIARYMASQKRRKPIDEQTLAARDAGVRRRLFWTVGARRMA